MRHIFQSRQMVRYIIVASILIACAQALLAVQPVVKTVPWVATNPLIPHDTWTGKPVTLKGTSSVFGPTITYTWDFGDGSPVATGTVPDINTAYDVEAVHTYTGVPGTVFTARLTVRDTSTGESANKTYLVDIQAQSLSIEVNRAIDEGLWYLHKTMRRTNESGIDYGDWGSGIYYADSGYVSNWASNLNAFFVNGHQETGDPNNPYTDTVKRGMRRIFSRIATFPVASQTNGIGTFTPDGNANGYGIYPDSASMYEGGMIMDAIVATGTPNAITTTGAAAGGGNPGVLGRTYKDIIQDMVDGYAYCQLDYAPAGAWGYGCNTNYQDNSVSQWAAIGLIAAHRVWGIAISAPMIQWSDAWVTFDQGADGSFGYNGPNSFAWGPYATTPSGLVQMAMIGKGRGDPRWDQAETYLRNSFGNSGDPTSSIRAYYYGMLSFVKSMLLHDSNGDGIAEPITLLQSSTAGVPPVDWYAAEVSKGAPLDGVARTVVDGQNAAGYWYGHNYSGTQFSFETGFAVLMLSRTLFTQGNPVAVPTATPNPAVGNQTVTFNGGGSFHQDPARKIVKWEWDLDNNGTFETAGVSVTKSFPLVGNYVATLRVTDDSATPLTATATVTVIVSTPPLAPTANAGGPYNFCPATQPWRLDGSKSVNPDDGQHELNKPGDFIKAYGWEINGDATFNDATGVQPDATAQLTALGVGSHLIQLKVTDNTSISFPSSGLPDLTSTASAQVFVRSAGDPQCSCVANLLARAKPGKADLTWTFRPGAYKYNVYRGTASGGPYSKIGTVARGVYADSGLTNGTTYYYVVREIGLDLTELCQSNQASVKPVAR
jgi:hypothetical protein